MGSTLQSTYLLLQDDGFVVAQLAYQIAGGLTSKSMLPSVSLDDDTARFTQLAATQIVSENGVLYSRSGVNLYSVIFENEYLTAKLGQNLNIAGGVVCRYDGKSVVESNFHFYPENIQLSASSSGGNMGTGTYEYMVLYRDTDNQRQIHRSNVSVGEFVVVTGPARKCDNHCPNCESDSQTKYYH